MFRGIPAAVTNSGLAEAPRRTAMACVAGLERGLGHADDGNAELSVHVCTKTRSAIWVQVDVAIDDDQAGLSLLAQRAEYSPDGRQFAQVELARPIGRNPGEDQRALLQHGGERGIGRGHDSCSGVRVHVVDIHSGINPLLAASGESHRSTMDHTRWKMVP
jgi:hypothetical protein